MIYEAKRYENEKGMVVVERKPIPDGGTILPSKYSGTVGIRTPGGMMPYSFEFPEGTDLVSAFEHFEEEATKAVEKLQEESRIIPASGMPPPSGNIITP